MSHFSIVYLCSENDGECEEVTARKAGLPKTRFGVCYNLRHVDQINHLTQRF